MKWLVIFLLWALSCEEIQSSSSCVSMGGLWLENVGTVTYADRDLTLALSCLLLQILDGLGRVKFCLDASGSHVGSWLKHVQFAPATRQPNLNACQVDDQVRDGLTRAPEPPQPYI